MPDQHNAVDAHIGLQVQRLRTERGLSRQQLGDVLAVVADEIDAIETGASRLRASQLFKLCNALGVSLASVFANLTLPNVEPVLPVPTKPKAA